MLEFRLKPPHYSSVGRVPRLNRAHPLFNNQHMVHCCVAQGGPAVTGGNGAMLDLITGASYTNTTTLGGVDAYGHYVWSNDSAGTATINMPPVGGGITSNATCWGAIFRVTGANRQYVWAVGANTGFWTNSLSVGFMIANGSQASFNAVAGHVYFCLQTNMTGAASQNRSFVAVDLTTGVLALFATGASSGNITTSSIQGLIVSLGVDTNRLYASFLTNSALVPPAVNPAATFYSIDQLMGMIADPWGLWYA